MLKKKKRRSRKFKDDSQIINLEDARRDRKKRREEAAKKKRQAKQSKKYVVTERQAGKKARRRMVYFFIFLFILCILGASIINIFSLQITETKTMEQQQALLKEKEKLENVYSQINSPEYIEQQARQQLKMIKPGEILYVLPDKEKNSSTGGIVPN